jgi:hypothetical protein
MPTEKEANRAEEFAAEETSTEEQCESSARKIIVWLTVGMAVAVFGVFLGFELRSRYKFNRRTPYDFYDHNFSEKQQTSEFGLGV